MPIQESLLSGADPSGKNTVSGVVSAIIYQNEENGYTVCEIQTKDGCETVTGVMPYLS